MERERSYADYLLLFEEICNGRSPFYLKGERFYFSHPSTRDFGAIERVREATYDKYVAKGIMPREDLIRIMKKQGNWDFDLEEEIKQLKIEIEDAETNFKAQVRKILVEKARVKLVRKRKNLAIAEQKLEAYIPAHNADALSEIEYSRRFVSLCFDSANDVKFEQFSGEDEDFIRMEFGKVVTERITEDAIKFLSVQNFFKSYYMFSTAQDMFGAPACKLTNNQITMLYYSSIFKDVFANHGARIPESAAEDPDMIMDILERLKEQDEFENRSESRKGATNDCDVVLKAKFGARKEDYEAMGHQEKFVDIGGIVGDKGTMDAQQFMQEITKK